MKEFNKYLKEQLKNDKFRKEYEKLEPEYQIMKAITLKREQEGLTQKELAEKVGTRQSAISRLESGTYNPSLKFLKKVSKALGVRLELKLK